ncbi:sigma 54-interacting transcriptional regulator [Pelagicoccus sp. SDUM812003]|uniref:sigma-54-dependent transcriptional regulator n=1 Tax=Pelagicoccus sp. SDUM812003 TaxID=3041267 RepID=UPI00280D091B|nr:sigma 54-interacting transcriptional regulator [Pelagicoccus sp. SDUM812003]MDQ8202880.1 sigma 54-interacting transcriptional regulator [Pelagicoccus sp. SDUM812003]
MPRNLFTREQWPLAQKLAAIVYCNPFEETRWNLEKECLGGDYQERAAYVAPGDSEELLAPNLKRLLGLAHELMESARTKLKAAGEASQEEQGVYENLMHFLVYHEMMERYDKLIDKTLSGRPRAVEAEFYYEYRERQRYYLAVSPATRFSTADEALYFALYFQLRRAWLNIYRYLVGGSQAICELRGRIWNSCFTRNMQRYQRSLYNRMGDIVTLITGPSGSGKELVARAVGMSRFMPFDERSSSFAVDFGKAFYPLNLSALSPTLIESELFGHRKGAFTGALQDRSGYFEECGEYGTVFLDEIGETDCSIQVKLLRVLQTRQFQRLGDTSLRPFVGKVMAATNRDLPDEIAKGSFREDFYFRLCADRIRTPSLSEIIAGDTNELELLVRHIACKVAGPEDGEALAEESCDWIVKRLGPAYRWPGNFRELEQCVRNIMVHGSYETVDFGLSQQELDRIKDATEQGLTANQLLSRYAQEVYLQRGSYEETAKVLQVDRRTAKRYVLGVD